jgi:hypothetical protein
VAPEEHFVAAAVIDTREIASDLRHAGFPEAQAEAIARQLKRRYEADRDELGTRAYLDAALANHFAETRAEPARHDRDLVLKLGGIVTAAVAIVGALGVVF